MNDKTLRTITNIIAITLLVVSIVFVALMYIGPKEEIVNEMGDTMSIPNFTDALMGWTYGLLIATAALTVIFALVKFVKNMIANPKGSIKTIVTLVVFALIFIISWNVGSPEEVSIFGYEGNQNVGFWSQFADMVIYAGYTLFALIILAIIGSQIYTKLK